jgi:hypothetical protein
MVVLFTGFTHLNLSFYPRKSLEQLMLEHFYKTIYAPQCVCLFNFIQRGFIETEPLLNQPILHQVTGSVAQGSVNQALKSSYSPSDWHAQGFADVALKSEPGQACIMGHSGQNLTTLHHPFHSVTDGQIPRIALE